MIIDSHAHYNNSAFKKPFRYLTHNENGYSLKDGDRDQLFRELQDANIPCSIEPGVSLQSCEEILQLCAEYPGRIIPAMGIHPTKSVYEKWSDRKKLDAGIVLAHLFVANEETFRFFRTETISEIPGHGYIGSFTI